MSSTAADFPITTMDVTIQGRNATVVMGEVPETAVMVFGDEGHVGLLAIQSKTEATTVVFARDKVEALIAAIQKFHDPAR